MRQKRAALWSRSREKGAAPAPAQGSYDSMFEEKIEQKC